MINKLFFRGIRHFNPSQKYLSTTLITSISTMIHHILGKKNYRTSEVLLTIDFWSKRHMHSYIGITVHFISNQKLHNAMLACR